jgi:hypothetical protein
MNLKSLFHPKLKTMFLCLSFLSISSLAFAEPTLNNIKGVLLIEFYDEDNAQELYESLVNFTELEKSDTFEAREYAANDNSLQIHCAHIKDSLTNKYQCFVGISLNPESRDFPAGKVEQNKKGDELTSTLTSQNQKEWLVTKFKSAETVVDGVTWKEFTTGSTNKLSIKLGMSAINPNAPKAKRNYSVVVVITGKPVVIDLDKFDFDFGDDSDDDSDL